MGPRSIPRSSGVVAAVLSLLLVSIPSGQLDYGAAHPPTAAAPTHDAGALAPARPPSAPAQSRGWEPRPTSSGTPTWTDLSSTAGAPPPRISGGMAYDGEDGFLLVFGGEYLNTSTFRTTYYNDTWEFSGGHWTNITPSVSPSPRFGFGMAFDALDGYVVLFGGRNAAGYMLDDTWAFSGGHWQNLTLASAPPARFWPGMTYDSTDREVLLFGGYSASITDLNDTWLFSGGAWTAATPSTHPLPRHGSAMTDDPSANGILLFGGLGAQYYNDTWEYSGGDWHNRTGTLLSSTEPDARVGAGIAFDTAIGQAVMYGGYPANTYAYGTWLFTNLSWSLYNFLPNGPASTTIWGQLAYDAADAWVVYLVPNSNETFVFSETAGGFLVVPSVSPLAGTVPLTVNFSAVISGGTGAYNVTWSVGDGRFLYSDNGSITYSTPGTYALNLSVRDSAAGRFYQSWPVSVGAVPLTASTSIRPSPAVVGQPVAFNASYAGGWPPYTYAWSFGDGTSAITQNATHAYGAAGTFTVSFTLIAGFGGSKVVTSTELVQATAGPLVLNASLGPRSGEAPFRINAASTPGGGVPPYVFRWTWGDASSVTATENASHVYEAAGVYDASLLVSDANGSSQSRSWTISVLPTFTVAITTSLRYPQVGEAVTFTATPLGGSSPYVYGWTLGEGQTSSNQNATASYNETGVVTVSLAATDSLGYRANASFSLTVAANGSAAPAAGGGSWGPIWLVVIVLAILVAFIAVVVVWRRRRRSPPSAPLSGTAPP